MRYKVKTEYGYASFDEEQRELAEEYYREQADRGLQVQMYEQENVMDEGIIVMGTSVEVVDLSIPQKWTLN